MGIRQGENGKAGEGQMAGPTHASANFDPIVSLVMSLLAPPAVRSNRIAQTPRTTAQDRFLAGGSPVQIWVARITAKWDKNNRTAWEALSLNRLLSGSVFRRGLPLPHEIRMKAIIPSSSRFCGGSDQDRPVNHEKAGPCQEFFALSMSSSLFFPFSQAASVATLPSALFVERLSLGARWVYLIQ
jgi:hypothetical protein